MLDKYLQSSITCTSGMINWVPFQGGQVGDKAPVMASKSVEIVLPLGVVVLRVGFALPDLVSIQAKFRRTVPIILRPM